MRARSPRMRQQGCRRRGVLVSASDDTQQPIVVKKIKKGAYGAARFKTPDRFFYAGLRDRDDGLFLPRVRCSVPRPREICAASPSSSTYPPPKVAMSGGSGKALARCTTSDGRWWHGDPDSCLVGQVKVVTWR